jgi:hypothetical protein
MVKQIDLVPIDEVVAIIDLGHSKGPVEPVKHVQAGQDFARFIREGGVGF